MKIERVHRPAIRTARFTVAGEDSRGIVDVVAEGVAGGELETVREALICSQLEPIIVGGGTILVGDHRADRRVGRWICRRRCARGCTSDSKPVSSVAQVSCREQMTPACSDISDVYHPIAG